MRRNYFSESRCRPIFIHLNFEAMCNKWHSMKNDVGRPLTRWAVTFYNICLSPLGPAPGLPDGTYIFKPKITVWVKFWRALEWKRLVYSFGHLEYITVIWYIFRPCGNVVAFWCISPVLVYCVNKIWQPWPAQWRRENKLSFQGRNFRK
jgi:hypothetical protein